MRNKEERIGDARNVEIDPVPNESWDGLMEIQQMWQVLHTVDGQAPEAIFLVVISLSQLYVLL